MRKLVYQYKNIYIPLNPGYGGGAKEEETPPSQGAKSPRVTKCSVFFWPMVIGSYL
jgi:hypothetical protein